MIGDVGRLRSVAVVSDKIEPKTQTTNDRGIQQLPGEGPKASHTQRLEGTNPLYKSSSGTTGEKPTVNSHYITSEGTLKPRGIKPLDYDSTSLQGDVGKLKTWGGVKNALKEKAPIFGEKSTYGQMLGLAEKFSTSSKTMTGSEKVGLLQDLANKIGSWQTKHGDGTGTIPSTKETAIAKLKASIGPALEEAKFDKLREDRTSMLSKMPEGMKINGKGVISGSHEIRGIPKDAKGMGEYAGLTSKEFVATLGAKAIIPKLSGKEGEKVEMPLGTIAGIPVAGQAPKDLYRLDMTIPTSSGIYQSKTDPEKAEGERNKTAVTKLREFAGSDKATTVLTGVLNQQLLRPLSDGMTKQDGSQAIVQLGSLGSEGQVKQPDGSLEKVKMYNMGGAKFDLSKMENGNFKISIDWPMHITHSGRSAEKEDLPGMKEGQVIGAHGKMEFIVDARAAAKGVLQVYMPNPATVQFSGGLNS